MTKYIQTNEKGYVTGIVEEHLLIGLFGGTKTIEIPDEEASNYEEALKVCHSQGEGLHIDDLVRVEKQKN